jgi:hypothetical protein
LLRSGFPVRYTPTGNGGTVLLADDQHGPLPPGLYRYKVGLVVGPGAGQDVGELPVRVDASDVPAGAGQVQSDVAPDTLARAGTFERDLLIEVLGQGGLFRTAAAAPAPAAAATAPATVATAPAAAPPGPVTVNQLFGKIRVGGAAVAGSAPRRFSLFHHKAKSRPTIKTVGAEGLSAAAVAAAPGVQTPPSPQTPVAPAPAPASTTAPVGGAGTGQPAPVTAPPT